MTLQLFTQAMILVSFLFSPSTNESIQDSSTYDKVIAGMRTFKNPSGDLESEYRVGQSLRFGIVAPGKPDASVYFYSTSFEGDYFAVVNISDGCVVVRPGQKATLAKRTDLAFVSIRDGMVFRTIEELRKAK
jgi:hypothetical protein